MKPKHRQQRRKVAGLTCGQMVLLFISIVVLFMGAALVLGYTLGIFDRLITPGSSSDQPVEIQTPQANTPLPDGLSPTTSAAAEDQSSISPTLARPGSVTATTFESLSTPPTTTFTPTITPTPPADVCAQLDLGFINATSNVAAWRLQNSSGVSLTLSRIEIEWPGSNDAIFNAILDGTLIWSTEDLVSPSFITTWIGEPGDRVVEGLSRLEFLFGTAAASSGYDLTLRFDNGCEVSNSN
ncbi:MAG: hypothetical protein E4G99_07800 [Anaerolineales bacterium]|nr:MAG: hypothetical protein E4G99_07800 [Anaerolineales bacterium]